MSLIVKKEKLLDSIFWEKFDSLVKDTVEFSVNLNSIWLSNYIEYYFEKNQKPYIISVYLDDSLVGCLPLQMKEVRGTRFYNLIELRTLGFGPSDFFEIPAVQKYNDIIFDAIVDFLKLDKSWDFLILTEFPESSTSLKQLKDNLLKHKFDVKRDTPNGFYSMRTDKSSWALFEESYFNPNNKDLLKSLRRINKQGFELKVVHIEKNIYQNLIKCLELYSQRRETLGQFNNYETPKLRSFLKNVIVSYEKNGNVELSILKEKDVIWAFQLDWIFNGVRYHWNHAFNEDFKRYSPGKILLKELLKKSFNDNNVVSCNHMRGLSNYKTKFTDRKEMLVRLKVENPKSFRLKLTKAISKILRIVKN